jgi:hypothetical protein
MLCLLLVWRKIKEREREREREREMTRDFSPRSGGWTALLAVLDRIFTTIRCNQRLI